MIGSEIRALRFDPPVLAASFACNLLALATPLLILHVFDRVIPNAAGATLAIRREEGGGTVVRCVLPDGSGGQRAGHRVRSGERE